MTTDESPRLAATRSFFGPRAAGWEDRFPGDEPGYRLAVAALSPPPGGVALDVGCGTGRALPWLRQAVGGGMVIGLDATPEMLAEALRLGRGAMAVLVLADAGRLPLPAQSVDTVLAAGLLPHLPDPADALMELARVARPGAALAIFHPIGRAALAARHGHQVSPDDPLAPEHIGRLLQASGWQPTAVDDGPERYLALAVRRTVSQPAPARTLRRPSADGIS